MIVMAAILILINISHDIANLIVYGPVELFEKGVFRFIWIIILLFSIVFIISVSLKSKNFPILSSQQGILAYILAVFLVNNLRLMKFLTEIENFRLIYETAHHISGPILSKFLFIYLVYYMYAQLGQIFFVGSVTQAVLERQSPGTPDFYYLMNFNDYGSSIITLFHQMIVNNWFVTVNMFVDILGYPVGIRCYFVTFWLTTVLVQLNIVISIILEIYGSVTDKVQGQTRVRKMQVSL